MYSPDLHNELRDRINISDERPFPGIVDSPRNRPPSEERGNGYSRGRHPSDDSSPRAHPASPRSPRATSLSHYSSPLETRDWLDSKGFSRRFVISMRALLTKQALAPTISRCHGDLVLNNATQLP